jgi:competence protein ComEA
MPTWLTVQRRRALALAALAAVTLLLGVRHFSAAKTPSVVPGLAPGPAAVPAAPVTKLLVVHVVGAVRRPGLYRISDRSRVADAVRRAGGSTRRADLSLINLAAPLADGLQVVVPRRQPAGGAGVAAAAGGGAGGASGPVHLNTATLEQLDALPGVGPVTAQKILDYRTENGAFTSVDDLDAVPGIGPARLENLRELVAP